LVVSEILFDGAIEERVVLVADDDLKFVHSMNS
jgi:hypothetical protein